MDQLRELYDVRSLDPSLTTRSTTTSTCWCSSHPRGLEDSALYAIDQFVMRGGKVVAFVDPNAEAQPQTGPGGVPMPLGDRRSQIDGLLASWGVSLRDDAVVGDLALGLKVRTEQGGRLEAFDYPVWLDVPQSQFAERRRHHHPGRQPVVRHRRRARTRGRRREHVHRARLDDGPGRHLCRRGRRAGG